MGHPVVDLIDFFGKVVGDPGIEPGVRLREGVTVPIKLINFNCLIRFGPKDISTTKRILGTNVFLHRGGSIC